MGNVQKYHWNEESKTLLMNYLATKEKILHVENKIFPQNQEGVDEANKMVTDIMINITENCCKCNTAKKKRKKRTYLNGQVTLFMSKILKLTGLQVK